MRRALSTVGIYVTIVFAVVLYREWIIRNSPPTFLPLGFFEQSLPSITPETQAQDPRNWIDPVTSILSDDKTFASAIRGAELRSFDVIVFGSTLAGYAAAIAAAEDGVQVALVTAEDWQAALVPSVTQFLTEPPWPISSNDFERELRELFTGGMEDEKFTVLPRDIAAYIRKRVDALPSITTLPGFAVSAALREHDGSIQRLMLHNDVSETSIYAKTTYVVDATKEGELMAKLGIQTRVGWEAAGSLTDEVIAKMAKGYSMSGRTIQGLGMRLDGMLMGMAILDKGYAGRFVAPDLDAQCWAPSETAPFIAGGTVSRPRQDGCIANIDVTASYADIVEIYFINHGRNRVKGEVHMGSGTHLSIDVSIDPRAKLAYAGAFPVSPGMPLSLRIVGVKNWDVEGVIVRKLNVSGDAVRLDTDTDEITSFTTDNWHYTTHDIYAIGKDGPSTTFRVDETTVTAQRVGHGTFLVSGISLMRGVHDINTQGADIKTVLIIPKKPYQESAGTITKGRTDPETQTTEWTLSPEKSTNVTLLVPIKTCATGCAYTVSRDNGRGIVSYGNVAATSASVASAMPLATFDIEEGVNYRISITSPASAHEKPFLIHPDNSSKTHHAGIGMISVNPSHLGDVHDIWIRTYRAPKARVTAAGQTIEIDTGNAWLYVGTSALSSDGITASVIGGGGIELLTIPNPGIDTYHIALTANEKIEARLSDIPSGIYSAIHNPEDAISDLEIRDANGKIHSISRNGSIVAQRIILGGTDTLLVGPSNFPLHVVLHELPPLSNKRTAWANSGSLTVTALWNPLLSENIRQDVAMSTSGVLLFQPMPRGIGPAMIGTINDPQATVHTRDEINNFYVQLKYSQVYDPFVKTCNRAADPRCDSRRYAREPAVFGTPDAISPHPSYPDVRRLVGKEVLDGSGSFLELRECARCTEECIPGSISDDKCITPAMATRASDKTILSVRGVVALPTMVSPTEEYRSTFANLMKTMRHDGVIAKGAETYLERPRIGRDIGLTLGMFLPASGRNVLAGNTTLSSTHEASRSLRSSIAELAIGNTIGHVIGFAIRREASPLGFIDESPQAFHRLRLFLVEKGITVEPIANVENDPLLIKATQKKLILNTLDSKPAWADGRIVRAVDRMSPQQMKDIRNTLFGTDAPITVRRAITLLPNADPAMSDIDLLSLGLNAGLSSRKMLQLPLAEILEIYIDEPLLKKMDYLLNDE